MNRIETAAVRAAQADWAKRPMRERLGILRTVRHAVVAKRQALCDAVAKDLGRPAGEVVAAELLPLTDAVRFLERDAARVLAPRKVPQSRRPIWLFGERDVVYRQPLGVVGVVGTWNYPLFLNGVQAAQALAAGNGVVWKPSEVAPASAEALHQLFLDAGVPADLFVRLPATREAGVALAEADVDHVVFTGSAATGAKLAARLGERLVPSTLELSGCDAMFVLPDADVPLAARAAWFAATTNRGQTCIATRRAFVHRTVEPAFVGELRKSFANAAPMPLATAGQIRHAERLVADARERGGEVVAASGSAAANEFAPTLVLNATPAMAVCREDSFAPLLAVLPFDVTDRAVAMHDESPYGLGASVFGHDGAADLAAKLRVGLVTVNDAIAAAGHPATPFGGRGRSGWGTTQGAEGLLAMTTPQVVAARGGTFRPHFDPVTPAMADMLTGLLTWRHAATWGERMRGLWRTVAAARRVGR
ncbi:MAG: aldehyde dehydrogenase family protein [Gemmataceae bacterium]